MATGEVTSEAIERVPAPADAMLSLIDRAVSSPDFDVNKLKELLEMRERWERNEARKAFVAAMNAFKEHPPELERVKKVDFSSKGGNRVHYNYAPLDHVAKVLGSALSKHNLSFRWNVQQTDGRVNVTCILQHSEGHSESVSMVAGLHDDDRMNAIQRLGSTVTYLERYTLLAATGTATQEQDTDANDIATNGELAEQLESIANTKDSAELKKIYGAAYRKFEVNPAALKVLIAARDKKLEEWK